MQEETKTQPNRIQWKFHQILLMLLPGIIFLTLYPVHYREALEKAAHGIFKDPQSWPPDTVTGDCRLQAGIRAGIVTAAGTVLCALVVSFTQPTGRLMLRKTLIAFGFMMAVNVILCGGGLAFGHHVNRSLEDAIGRIRRTPIPEPAARPAPQAQKP